MSALTEARATAGAGRIDEGIRVYTVEVEREAALEDEFRGQAAVDDRRGVWQAADDPGSIGREAAAADRPRRVELSPWAGAPSDVPDDARVTRGHTVKKVVLKPGPAKVRPPWRTQLTPCSGTQSSSPPPWRASGARDAGPGV